MQVTWRDKIRIGEKKLSQNGYRNKCTPKTRWKYETVNTNSVKKGSTWERFFDRGQVRPLLEAELYSHISIVNNILRASMYFFKIKPYHS